MLPVVSHFCLALMLSILGNGVLFFHSHELANGKIITHAHPILTEEQETLPDHGHSDTELITLDLLADADYDFFVFELTLPVSEQSVGASLLVFSSEIVVSQHLFGFEHRGPPSAV
jgi:hypothetical protein